MTGGRTVTEREAVYAAPDPARGPPMVGTPTAVRSTCSTQDVKPCAEDRRVICHKEDTQISGFVLTGLATRERIANRCKPGKVSPPVAGEKQDR